MRERVGGRFLLGDGVRLHASRLSQSGLRPEPLLKVIDDRIIGHDPIISEWANIASPDLSDANPYAVRIVCGVSDGKRIRDARKDAGMTQAELGEAMGVTQSVVSDWENGRLSSWQEHRDKLARVLSKPAGYFAAPQNTLVLPAGIEVVGEIQAGVFRSAIEVPPGERAIIRAMPPLGYEHLRLAALKVVGPSMDLVYPDGSYVVVVSAYDTDVRNGDRVVVYRSQGLLREATLKEVQVEPDGRVALWPRSSHPDHQEPIYLNDAEQDGPEIAYVVVARYQDEDRPPQPVQIARKRA